MALKKKILYHNRVSGSLASKYSPDGGKQSLISEIFIFNTTTGNATIQLCVDGDGTTYDQTTAILWNRVVTANRELHIQFGDESGIPLTSISNVAAFCTASGALTLSLLGKETIL